MLLQGVLINQGWEVKGATGDASVACLAKLPIQQLCPVGFIFIWVDKVHVRLLSFSTTLLLLLLLRNRSILLL